MYCVQTEWDCGFYARLIALLCTGNDVCEPTIEFNSYVSTIP